MLKSVLMLIGVILTIHSIILCHEAGHYLAARIFKIKVKTFTVGLGKTIWQYIDNLAFWNIPPRRICSFTKYSTRQSIP